MDLPQTSPVSSSKFAANGMQPFSIMQDTPKGAKAQRSMASQMVDKIIYDMPS
jgi:hypothetical protein